MKTREIPSSAVEHAADNAAYNVNLSRRIAELQSHAGQLAAHSKDGSRTYCFADTYEEIYENLSAAGLMPNEVVIGTIIPEGETHLL